MKSRIYGLRAVILYIREIVSRITEDQIPVYAAQASFFVIISAVPFLSMLISIAGMFLPTDLTEFFEILPIPAQFADIFHSFLDEIRDAPNVSLLSLSAVTTLWSASKGVAAIRSGLEIVYHAGSSRRFMAHRLRSLLSTLFFIAVLIAAVILLLFGDFLAEWLRLVRITDVLLVLRTPLFILFLSILFTAMYASTAKRSETIRKGILTHIPGALFSSVGWTLFSYFYSLYITHFPNASYLYGGLAAVCLIMLWLYFCMMILLLGAELNKFCFAGKNK